MTKDDPKVELLRRVPLFSLCDDKELQEIASLADITDVAEGEALTREGAQGHEFFVIEEGAARVTIGDREVAVLGPGEFVGEMALLDEGPRVATVTATSPLRVFVLSSQAFSSLLDRYPSVARKVMRGMAGRLREAESGHTH